MFADAMRSYGLKLVALGGVLALSSGCVEQRVAYTPEPGAQSAKGSRSAGTAAASAGKAVTKGVPVGPPPKIVVSEPPPPAPGEVKPPSPGVGYAWRPGCWYWTKGGWMWLRGNWVIRPHRQAKWVAPHCSKHGQTYEWVGGYWR